MLLAKLLILNYIAINIANNIAMNIAGNNVSDIADYSEKLRTILLISNISVNLCNIANNFESGPASH